MQRIVRLPRVLTKGACKGFLSIITTVISITSIIMNVTIVIVLITIMITTIDHSYITSAITMSISDLHLRLAGPSGTSVRGLSDGASKRCDSLAGDVIGGFLKIMEKREFIVVGCISIGVIPIQTDSTAFGVYR